MTPSTSSASVAPAHSCRNWVKRHWPLLLAVACIIVLRLVSAYHVYDVFRDEVRCHAQVRSLADTGRDTLGNRFSVYAWCGDGGGFVTCTYYYPMALLCRMFGQSYDSARLLQQILTILSCFLLAATVRKWGGGARRAWIVLVVSLTLPWGFVQANRLWDPALVPVYFSIAFWFATNILRAGPGGARNRHVAGAAVFLVLLATIYPPNRIPAALLWLWLFFAAWREGKVSMRQLALAVACSAVASLLLLYGFFWYPDFNNRSLDLFVFHGRSFRMAVFLLCESFARMFNGDFLFVTGDQIPRHSLPVFGMLGPLSVVPLWTLLRRCRFERPLSLMAGLIVLTYFSVSLTYEYSPHGLRSCLAWMPWAVLLGYGWDAFLEGKKPWARWAWYAAYAVWFAVYFGFYMSYNR